MKRAKTPVTIAVQMAKGAVALGTYAYVASTYGAEALREIRDRLPAHVTDELEAADATDETPYPLLVALWESIDQAVGRDAPQWAEDAGAYSIESGGVQLYGGILRKATPQAFLTQSISLFRLYYHPGDITVVEDAPGRAILRLVDFDPLTRLFCRRLTGGLRRAVELAGGESARVRHVRCSIEGDAFCEWQLEWHVPRG